MEYLRSTAPSLLRWLRIGLCFELLQKQDKSRLCGWLSLELGRRRRAKRTVRNPVHRKGVVEKYDVLNHDLTEKLDPLWTLTVEQTTPIECTFPSWLSSLFGTKQEIIYNVDQAAYKQMN